MTVRLHHELWIALCEAASLQSYRAAVNVHPLYIHNTSCTHSHAVRWEQSRSRFSAVYGGVKRMKMVFVIVCGVCALCRHIAYRLIKYCVYWNSFSFDCLVEFLSSDFNNIIFRRIYHLLYVCFWFVCLAARCSDWSDIFPMCTLNKCTCITVY